LHCSAVPTNVKLEYMQILIKQSSSSNKIQKINSSNPSITNYFDSSAEVDARERINQALEISSVLNKINEELKNEDNLTLGVKGGGLKTPVKTRRTTTWDCCDSIIRLEICLKNVLETQPEIFHDSSV
ncbi:14342_t:CDS:2, partial [Entrophospora sp. SA101]